MTCKESILIKITQLSIVVYRVLNLRGLNKIILRTSFYHKYYIIYGRITKKKRGLYFRMIIVGIVFKYDL